MALSLEQLNVSKDDASHLGGVKAKERERAGKVDHGSSQGKERATAQIPSLRMLTLTKAFTDPKEKEKAKESSRVMEKARRAATRADQESLSRDHRKVRQEKERKRKTRVVARQMRSPIKTRLYEKVNPGVKPRGMNPGTMALPGGAAKSGTMIGHGMNHMLLGMQTPLGTIPMVQIRTSATLFTQVSTLQNGRRTLTSSSSLTWTL